LGRFFSQTHLVALVAMVLIKMRTLTDLQDQTLSESGFFAPNPDHGSGKAAAPESEADQEIQELGELLENLGPDFWDEASEMSMFQEPIL
jgi:hypothetical protein